MPQQWFIFSEELPQPIRQGVSTPPPKIPVEHLKSLRGASLMVMMMLIMTLMKIMNGVDAYLIFDMIQGIFLADFFFTQKSAKIAKNALIFTTLYQSSNKMYQGNTKMYNFHQNVQFVH